IQPLNKLVAILKPQNLTLHEKSEVLRTDMSWHQETLTAMETYDSEESRQKFRHFQYSEVSGPHEALSKLWDLCRQWLRPEIHSKEQILELLVLEQFRTILPEEVRAWINLQHPKNSKDVVTLIEDVIEILKDKDTPLENCVLQNGSTRENMEADSLTGKPQCLYVFLLLSFLFFLCTAHPLSKPVEIPKLESKKERWIMEGEVPRRTIWVPKQRASTEESSYGVIMTRFTKSEHPFLEDWKSEDWLHGIQKNWNISLLQEASIHKTLCTEEGDSECIENKKSFNSVNSIWNIQQGIPMRKGLTEEHKFKTNFKSNSELVRKKHLEYNECGNALILSTHIIQPPKSHTTVNFYECYQCGKAFSRTSSLIRHQIIHTGEKPYKCSECGRLFNRNTNLIKHKKIHTKAKIYEDNKSGKALCKREDNNKNPRLHSGDSSYECVDCGKSFNRSSSLIRHQMIHTGEKPFKCKDCKKNFNRHSNLIKHQKLHARDQS
uniref:Zinc finger protein 215 n=1 Tax=Spermophilus dauricus TaxID=99837 RepID=A0A8C9P5X4_SPEDA